MNEEVLLVEDIAKVLHLQPNTIHSKRWKERSGCPLVKHGRRLFVSAQEFWNWFNTTNS
jgi:hypothetical protein